MAETLKKIGRGLLKAVGILVAIVVLVVGGVAIYLQTSAGKSFLRDQALSAINGALAGEVEIERIDGSILGGAELYGVVVIDGRGNVAARIPKATVDYSLLPLVQKHLVIDEVRIERPFVLLKTYEDGTFNFATLVKDEPKQPSKPSTFKVSVNDIGLGEGLLVFDDRSKLADLDDRALVERLDALVDDAQAGEVDHAAFAERFHALISGTDLPPMALLGAHDVELSGRYLLYGEGKQAATIDRLAGITHTDPTLGTPLLELTDVAGYYSPKWAEVSLERLALGDDLEIEGMAGKADFETTENEFGALEAAGMSGYWVALDRLYATARAAGIFTAAAPLRSPVTAEARLAGAGDELWYVARAGCADDGEAKLAGHLRLPGGTDRPLEASGAALFDSLAPSRCLVVPGPAVRAQGGAVYEITGTNPQTMAAQVELGLLDGAIADHPLQGAYLEASAEDGTFRIDAFAADTPFARASAAGMFNLDGRFDLEAYVDSRDEVEALRPEGLGEPVQIGGIDLLVDAEGELNLDADAPLAKLVRLDLQSNWNLSDFAMGDARIASSAGQVVAEVVPVDGTDSARKLTYRADVSARGVDVPGLAVSSLDVVARGQGRVDPPLDSPLAVLRGLSTAADVRVRSLRTPQASLGRANLDLGLRPTPGQKGFGWSAAGTVARARFGDNRIGQGRVDLTGTARLDGAAGAPALARIAAQGQIAAQDAQLGPASIAQIEATVDVAGPPEALHGTADLEAQTVKLDGMTIDRLAGQARLQPDRRFGLDVTAERQGEPTIEASLGGRISRGYDEFTLDRGRISGDDMTWAFQGEMHLDPAAGVFRFDDFRLQADGQSIAADGVFRLRGKQDLVARLDSVRIGELRTRLGLEALIPPMEGTISAAVEFQGTARTPRFSIELYLDDYYVNGYGPFAVALAATYAEAELAVRELKVAAYGSRVLSATALVPVRLDLGGDYELLTREPIAADIKMLETELSNFYGPLPMLERQGVRGLVGGQVELSGTIVSPTIALAVDADGFAFQGMVGGDYLEISDVTLRSKLDYEPPSNGRGGIDVTTALTWRDDDVFTATLDSPLPLARWINEVLEEPGATIDWTERLGDEPFTAAVEIDGLDLAQVPLQSFARADAEGEVSMALSAGGTFSEPNASLIMKLQDLGWEQYRDIYATLDADFRDQTILLDALRLEWDGDEILVAEGEIPVPTDAILGDEPLANLPIELAIQLRELPLSKLSAIDYNFARYRGQVAGYLTATGTLRDPVLEGRVGMFNIDLGKGTRGTFAASFVAEDDQLAAELLACQNYETVLEGVAELPVTTNMVALFEGQADLLRDEPLYAHLKSDRLDLARIVPEYLTEGVASDIEGIVEMNVELRGPPDDLALDGAIEMDSVALTLEQYGRRLEKINMTARFDPDKIELVRLRVDEDESWIKAEGTIGLDGLSPTRVDLDLAAEQFNIAGFAPLPALVTARADITGELTSPEREIVVTVPKVEVTILESDEQDLLPTELNQDIVVLKRQETVEEVIDINALLAPEEGATNLTRTRFKVIVARDSWVHHPLGDVEFAADLTGTIVGSRTEIVGQVDTVRGNFAFMGKNFDIPEKEAAIRFTGSTPPMPVLDLEAIHPIESAVAAELEGSATGKPQIVLNVRGRAEDPSLVLTSDPPLTENEILFVLLTGRAPTNEVGEGSQLNPEAVAVGVGSSILAGLVQRELTGSIPVDYIRVESGKRGLEDSRIRVGKYITNEIFISYAYRFGADELEDEGSHIGTIEYRFAPRWKLVTRYTDERTGEMNVFWDVY